MDVGGVKVEHEVQHPRVYVIKYTVPTVRCYPQTHENLYNLP